MSNRKKEPEPSDLISGVLNIFGLKLDLGKLLSSPEEVRAQLEELREKLKQAGGKETLSDEEWRGGGVSISGHLRTRGILGDTEYHVGTSAPPRARESKGAPAPPLAQEPPVDVFQDPQEIVVVAEVPGVGLEDLELKAEGSVFSLATKPTAPRSYRKEIELDSPVEGESLQANCRNGILEIRLRKSRPK